MEILNNIKIGRRLTIAFALVVAMLVGGTILAIYNVSLVYTNVQRMRLEAEKQMKVRDIESAIDAVIQNVANVILAEDMADKNNHLDIIDEYRADYKELYDWLKINASTSEGEALLASLDEKMAVLREVDDQVVTLVMEGNNTEAAKFYVTEVLDKRADVEEVLLGLIAWRGTRMDGVVQSANETINRNNITLLVAIAGATIFAIFLGIVLSKSITNPIQEAEGYLEKMAIGDFAFNIREGLAQRADEMGKIGKALDQLLVNMKGSLSQVREGMVTLSSSSTELSAVAMEMASSASEASSKARVVAAAAEEMSTSTISVAAGMEQATMNLRSVATSTEEMTATIGEIANNSEKARRITGQAVSQADRISTLVRELGRAAQEIGKVTETIASISNQTHLLALNATIEAARAGAAGKGFAVVATEIKELAQQTAAATEDIKNKVSGVQNSTGSAVTDIERISDVIREVSEIVTTIATAIEEQSVVTRDIAANISQATAGVRDANERVSQTATVAQSVARDIVGVSNVGSEIDGGSGQVQTSALELSNLADQLTGMIQKFKLN